MKHFRLLLTLGVLTSCSTGVKNHKNPDPNVVFLNDSAINLMMSPKTDHLDSAISILDKAITIDPDYFITYKVSVYCRQKNFEKASETVKNLERIEPLNPEGIFALGFLLEKSGHINEAKYQKALAINEKKLKALDSKDKNYLSVKINHAVNLIFDNQEELGHQELNKVLKLDTNNLTAKMLYNKSRTEILNQLTGEN